ncbi:MAG: MoaD/ThiS family protein [Bacillota bacterium]
MRQLKLNILLFSGLEKFIPGASFGIPFEVEVEEGATGRDLIKKLGIPEAQVFTILTNGKHFSFDEQFQPGDRVALFPPVGGG